MSGLDDVFLTEIANHNHVSIDEVRDTYEMVMQGLHENAKIHDFIPVLAMNTVRQYFHDRAVNITFQANTIEHHSDSIANDFMYFQETFAR
ncbi:DUF3562 domain-containing protein [Aquirhabdus parva]|uniref:DUF3562 domain-containing protein n=1 Tax=Aquirhabdus parva TaxID=2283318 RepID=A0A345P7N8_9GAMM|nr:DUF3562 domain-containing protein [Aquirhabdus parva]AXI03297.1 DUF3562 domain-containing protein [Aquirhabdus parva]